MRGKNKKKKTEIKIKIRITSIHVNEIAIKSESSLGKVNNKSHLNVRSFPLRQR